MKKLQVVGSYPWVNHDQELKLREVAFMTYPEDDAKAQAAFTSMMKEANLTAAALRKDKVAVYVGKRDAKKHLWFWCTATWLLGWNTKAGTLTETLAWNEFQNYMSWAHPFWVKQLRVSPWFMFSLGIILPLLTFIGVGVVVANFP